MTKQYDTQEQVDAFNIYVKQNPAGRQVHHTGTLGYDDDEWKAFQEGWNAALAQPKKEQDSTCSDTLRLQGKPYPRTCKKCGLGPCVAKPVAQSPPRAVKTYHEGKPVYVASRPRTFDDYGNKIV